MSSKAHRGRAVEDFLQRRDDGSGRNGRVNVSHLRTRKHNITTTKTNNKPQAKRSILTLVSYPSAKKRRHNSSLTNAAVMFPTAPFALPCVNRSIPNHRGMHQPRRQFNETPLRRLLHPESVFVSEGARTAPPYPPLSSIPTDNAGHVPVYGVDWWLQWRKILFPPQSDWEINTGLDMVRKCVQRLHAAARRLVYNMPGHPET